jgi:hypothetical protein
MATKGDAMIKHLLDAAAMAVAIPTITRFV